MKNDDLVRWSLVSDISQSLQISFASIKAAISSLIGGDIFWDLATQHEFMQTIDKSVDDLSYLTAVMTVAMRLESQTLTIHREPNSLQEILSRAKDQVLRHGPASPITLTLPVETRLALVDFEYLRMALRLLIEVLIGTRDDPLAPLSIQVLEETNSWRIIFDGGISGLAGDIVHWFCHGAPECVLLPANMRAETKLKALTSVQLFALHAIEMATNGMGQDSVALVLCVPFEIEA
jgi:hypothetical protein